MKLPNLIVGGAPKCGTSSLYFWLSEHPQVYASKTKETFFFHDKINKFNKSCNCFENRIEDYSNYFKSSKNEKVVFEATAAYLYSKKAISGFSKFDTIPKIIFLLREPSQQIYSHYKMENFRTRRVNEDFTTYSKRKIIIDRANYAKHLKKWYSGYPKNKIKLILYEELITEKSKVLSEICDFLEIDFNFYNNFSFQHRNKSVKIKSKKIHHISQKLQPLVPHYFQRLLLPVYLKINGGEIFEKSKKDMQTINKLKEKFLFLKKDLLQIDPTLNLKLWS